MADNIEVPANEEEQTLKEFKELDMNDTTIKVEESEEQTKGIKKDPSEETTGARRNHFIGVTALLSPLTDDVIWNPSWGKFVMKYYYSGNNYHS